MNPVAAVFLLGTIVVVLKALRGGGATSRSGETMQAWRAAARACDLAQLTTSADGQALTARRGPLRVRFERGYALDLRQVTRIVLQSLPCGNAGLTLRSEGLGSLVDKIMSGKDELGTGDAEFDAVFHVQGLPTAVRALLDVDTRRMLAALQEKSRVSISNGEICAELTEPSDGDVDRLAPALRLALNLAAHMNRAGDMATRLADIVLEDPLPTVRLACLLTLAADVQDLPLVRRTLTAAGADPDAEVRLRAGLALGAEGTEILRRVATATTADDECAADAIAALDELPVEKIRRILTRALKVRRRETARACVEMLGRSGGEAAAAQAVLLDVLARNSATLRTAAAAALGRVGSIEAVLPLQEAVDRHPGDRSFEDAAWQAIAEIQSRVDGADRGQLTVAEAEAGQLSLTAATKGQVSLPEIESGDVAIVEEPSSRRPPEKKDEA
jgi:hypothetical protein